jgi:hypothetical protein
MISRVRFCGESDRNRIRSHGCICLEQKSHLRADTEKGAQSLLFLTVSRSFSSAQLWQVYMNYTASSLVAQGFPCHAARLRTRRLRVLASALAQADDHALPGIHTRAEPLPELTEHFKVASAGRVLAHRISLPEAACGVVRRSSS